MARPRKISEEQLIEIIKGYMEDTPYIVSLKFSNLTKYAKEELGYENITYQDFSRNKKVQEMVNVYNDQKNINHYIRNNSDKLEKLNLNVDALVDKYSNDLRQLKVILKVFKDGYDRAFLELIKYGDSDKKNRETIKQQEEAIKELTEKNRELRGKLKSKTNDNQKSFRTEKLKWIYLSLNDMINQKNFYIEEREEIIDILKNFGYTDNDIADVENIIKDEFKTNNKIDNDELGEKKIVPKESNVVQINNKQLPSLDFLL